MSGVFEAVTLPFAARGMGCDEFVRDAGMGGACVLRVTTIRKDCIYYQQQPVAERKVRLVIIPFKMMIENGKTCEVQEQSIQSINGPWLPRAPTLHSDARDASTTFHAFQQHVRRRRPRPQERGSHHLCHRLRYLDIHNTTTTLYYAAGTIDYLCSSEKTGQGNSRRSFITHASLGR